MENNKTVTLVITTILIIILLIVGISYAYFSANITGQEESTTITVSGGTLNIIYNGGNDININNIIPSDNAFAIKTFTVTGNNTTDLDMDYHLSLIVVENTFTSGAIHYRFSGINTDLNGEVVNEINDTSLKTGSFAVILGSGKFIGNTNGNKVHTYSIEFKFPNTGENQNEDMGKTFNAYIETKEGFIELDNGYNKEKEVNKPVLVSGMTPLKWDGSKFIETTPDDAFWYDYDTKQWANARTKDGSYWVWIPRYAYKITSGYNENTTGTIDIKFLKGRTNETIDNTIVQTSGYEAHIKDTSTHYYLHPAFIFNQGELGFWVAKYESSNFNDEIKSEPNVISWRNETITHMFDISKLMKNKTNIYGWHSFEVDTHMLTNIEWGAIAYLSKSKYGSDTEEVWKNSHNEYLTGCSASSVTASNESTCTEYLTDNGLKASTTHNIYGVYDMSGGAWEYVSAYVDNNHPILNSNGKNLINSENKYKNIYITGATDTRQNNFEANRNIYGDAIYETSSTGENSTSWFGDNSYVPSTSSPFLPRGGSHSSGNGAGIFSYGYSNGASSSTNSWRTSIIVKATS